MLSGGARRLGAALGELAVREDPVAEADAVVVLGGAPRYRAPTAVTLWRTGHARRVVAVGGSFGHQEALRTHAVLRVHGVPEAAVLLLEEDAPGTWDEARLVARTARAQGWRRVLVVTSAYHTRRAGRLFEAAARGDFEVRMRAAADEPWRPDAWWRSRLHTRLLLAEPLKFLSWRSGARALWVRAGGRRAWSSPR